MNKTIGYIFLSLMKTISQLNKSEEVVNKLLLNAARDGELESLIDAIKCGADVNAMDRNKWTALMNAATNGHRDCVQALISLGADVNLQEDGGWTVLMFATLNRHTSIIKRLLEKGADPLIQNNSGKTALDIGIEQKQKTKGKSEIVSMLESAIEQKHLGKTIKSECFNGNEFTF